MLFIAVPRSFNRNLVQRLAGFGHDRHFPVAKAKIVDQHVNAQAAWYMVNTGVTSYLGTRWILLDNSERPLSRPQLILHVS